MTTGISPLSRPPRSASHRTWRRRLLKFCAHCIDGQADAANNRPTDALGTAEPEPGPGDEEDDDSEQVS